MNYKLHNKIEFSTNGKTYTFFNKVLSSVFEPLSKLQSFFSHIAVGTGKPSTSQESFKLTKHLKTFLLQNDTCQNDISLGNLFSKKTFIIDELDFNGTYITELGITNSNEINPTIFNYVSLISDDFPNGVLIEYNKPLLISVSIYLTIESNGIGLLTAGDNPFVKFLLGEGLSGEICTARGKNLSPNELTHREKTTFSQKYKCHISTKFENNFLSFDISSDLENEETYEIVFLIGEIPFARINLLEYKNTSQVNCTVSPKESFILDIGENVKSINKVTNETTSESEANYYAKSYANEFGDRISLPFKNLFNDKTPRFVSKDGDKIFFVVNDYIYGFKNEKYSFVELFTNNISIQHITNIISFDNFVFVVSKLSPYITAYEIKNNTLVKISLNLNETPITEYLETIVHTDITITNDNTLMIGFISSQNNNGFTLYFSYNENTKSFEYLSHIQSAHNFSYVLAMYKNNFCDARIFYLEEGEFSYNCRLVTHFADKTSQDIYTVLAYYYTKDTKEIYVKNRAIVIEKTTSPKLRLFYYPQVYEYELPLISDEENNYISTDLLYLIQKRGTRYQIYNLVGHNEPKEFRYGLPDSINQDEIVDFEFLNDSLLIFLDSETEPIIAFSLLENSMLIENISSIETNYLVDYNKYNLVGNKNEGVSATLSVDVSL